MDHDLLAGSVAHPDQRPISLTIDDGGMVERNRIRALITKALREAETLAMAGKSDQAIEQIQSLQDFETDNHLLLNSIAWSLAANSLCQPSHAACAVNLMERALKLQPDESSYWNTMGVAHYRNNDFRMAIEALQKSESLEPGKYYFDNAVFLAMSYWRMGEQTVARQWLSDAIRAFERQSSPTDELRRFRQDAENLVTPE
jgi:tetratricopeptide (TPR) repeat protein